MIDGKLTSKHFIASLPATEKPMPMIEPAIVRGVSDAKLLKQALGEYRTIINGLIDAVRQIEGQQRARERPDPRAASDRRPVGHDLQLPAAQGVGRR